MRTFFGVALLALGLVAVPVVSNAAPFGPNGCGGGGTVDDPYVCHLYAEYEIDGPSELGPDQDENFLGGYLTGYTFLLNAGADLAVDSDGDGDPIDEEDVAHILVIQNQLFQLFSKVGLGSAFGDAFDLALAAVTNPGLVQQIVGFPAIEGGVPHIGGVGYGTTADEVSMLVRWAFPDGSEGSVDVLTIHTAPPSTEPPTTVPEPGTLSLLGLGFASLGLRRRKAAL